MGDGGRPSPAVSGRAAARGADFSFASSDIKAIGAFFCNEATPKPPTFVSVGAHGRPRARVPDLVASRLPRHYHFRARIQSFQAVAAPFSGGCNERAGRRGRRARRFGQVEIQKMWRSTNPRPPRAFSRGDFANASRSGIPGTWLDERLLREVVPGSNSRAAVESGVLQCMSMGAFLRRRRATRNDSTNC
jgi:hypothetical protein